MLQERSEAAFQDALGRYGSPDFTSPGKSDHSMFQKVERALGTTHEKWHMSHWQLGAISKTHGVTIGLWDHQYPAMNYTAALDPLPEVQGPVALPLFREALG